VPGVSLWGGWGAWLRGWESLGWAGWGWAGLARARLPGSQPAGPLRLAGILAASHPAEPPPVVGAAHRAAGTRGALGRAGTFGPESPDRGQEPGTLGGRCAATR
jgi:hypothetical protein